MADVAVLVCDEKSLALLLKGAAEAHHVYEAELTELDANWPEWYAQWLCQRFAQPLVGVCGEEQVARKAQATVEALPQGFARVQTYSGPVSESFTHNTRGWDGKIYEHGPGWIAEAAILSHDEFREE